MKKIQFETIYRTIYEHNKVMTAINETKQDQQIWMINKFIDRTYKMACNNASDREIRTYQAAWRYNLFNEVFSNKKTFKALCREIYASLLEEPETK